MKKLMFAAAIMAAGAAVAVESGIVGYQNKGLVGGEMDMFGTCFKTISAAGLKVQDLKLSDGTKNEDFIDIYDSSTSEFLECFWATKLKKDGVAIVPQQAGWGIETSGEICEETLAPGQGFWIQTSNDNDMTEPGEVIVADEYTYDLVGGEMDMVCNPYPATIALQKISVSDGTKNEDFVDIYDSSTSEFLECFWATKLKKDGVAIVPQQAGWGIETSGEICEESIAAGQGFWIQTSNDCTIEFGNK